MIKFFTRACLLAGAITAISLAPAMAQPASSFPNRPVRFVVPYPAGGATDAVARVVAIKLTERWGQQVVVDNRPGGSGVIGVTALAKAPPDGYTISLVINTHVINSHILAKLPYDAAKDIVPVATMASSPFLLVTNGQQGARTLKDLIALGKSKQLNAGMVGSAGLGRVVAEQLAEATGIKIQNVAYKGSGTMLTDLLGGQFDFTIDTANVYLAQVQSGKLRALAVSGDKRLKSLPDVPTFAEAGLPNYEARMWFGVIAPAGTPSDIVGKLSSDIGKAVVQPDVVAKLEALEFSPLPLDAAQFADLLKSDSIKYGKIVRSANITAE
jgi:tripartite-type tricarboxylate transporter receptor subunit TctC